MPSPKNSCSCIPYYLRATFVASHRSFWVRSANSFPDSNGFFFFFGVCLIVDRFIFSPRSLIHWKLCSPWMNEEWFRGWSLRQNSTNGGNSSRPALFSSRQRVVQMAAFIKTRAYVNILKHRAVSPSQRTLLLWPAEPMLGSNNYTKQYYYFIFLINSKVVRNLLKNKIADYYKGF